MPQPSSRLKISGVRQPRAYALLRMLIFEIIALHQGFFYDRIGEIMVNLPSKSQAEPNLVIWRFHYEGGNPCAARLPSGEHADPT